VKVKSEKRATAARSRPGRGELPIAEHILMVNDLSRGEKYFEALHAKIRPGDVVLEVGTGAGLLSCMAVRLGAKHVYTIERSAALKEVARKVFAANGVSDKITLIHGSSEDPRTLEAIGEPIDVFVTETIGALALEEGILPIFEHVKPLLSPRAKVIPETLQFKHCLVNLSGIRERFEVLGPVLGFDLSALNAELTSNLFYWLNPIEPWREISTTAETEVYALTDFAAKESKQEMLITGNSVCDGMFVWAEFKLADRVVVDTRYRYLGQSWANAIYFMNRLTVGYGQRCTSDFQIAEDRVSWTINWHVHALEQRARQEGG
jgi:type II protein arginine methyltransferase